MDEAALRKKLENGPLTRDDVLAILDWQLSLPAEEMDCGLISECDLFLAPEGPRLSREREDALLASILGRIDAGPADGVPETASQAPAAEKRGARRARTRAGRAHRPHAGRGARGTLLLALLMLALLALAAGGVAYGYRRGVLNFTEGFGFAGMVSQPGAEELVSTSLAHVELEHVTIDVLEAVCDGAELRVVYGLTSPDGQVRTPERSDGYVMPGSEEGEVHMCDSILVNGQDAYFDDTWAAPGEAPGQVLYYLQTNLLDWGVDISGAETLEIGLPLFPGDAESGLSRTLDFSIPAGIPQTAMKTAELASADMDGLRASLESAVFSPINGYVRLRIDRLTRERFNVDFAWSCAVYASDGTAITNVRITDTDFYDGYAVLAVKMTPMADAWPDELTVAFKLTDGQDDWTATLRLL